MELARKLLTAIENGHVRFIELDFSSTEKSITISGWLYNADAGTTRPFCAEFYNNDADTGLPNPDLIDRGQEKGQISFTESHDDMKTFMMDCIGGHIRVFIDGK